jgi:hypothetical protein
VLTLLWWCSALPVLAGHRHTHRHLSRPLLHSTQAVQRLQSRIHMQTFYFRSMVAVIERYSAVHVSDFDQKKKLRTCVCQTYHRIFLYSHQVISSLDLHKNRTTRKEYGTLIESFFTDVGLPEKFE